MVDRRPRSGADPTPRRALLRSALSVLLVALVSLVAMVLPVGSGAVAQSDTARVWHVAPWGNDDASGTIEDPLGSATEAVARAVPGDTIELRGGVYHESVMVFDTSLTIRSRDGERAIFDGAVVVDDFQRDGDRWVADGWWRQFYREPSGGPVSADHLIAGYPDQMFLDGRPLDQVLHLAEVGPGTFFHDIEADRLWIGDDPAGRVVEASRYRWAFYFQRAEGSRLEGVTVRRYATEARDMAAIRAYSDDLTLTELEVSLNARMGLSVIGTGITVSDSRFVDNGYIGVHGERAAAFTLERSAVLRNNRESFDPFHSAAGVKVTRSAGVTFRENDVSWNGGPGIWTDLDTRFVTIVRNVMEGNRRAGLEIELSSDLNVLSNVALDNGEAGIWVLESQNVQVLHNASFGNVNGIEVEEGPRREVRNVRIMNNTLGDPAPGTRALLDVNDWTGERSASEMGVMVDANAFWLRPEQTGERLTRWGRWPDDGIGYATDLSQHRNLTGQGWNSLILRQVDNPFARSSIDGDFRGLEWLQSGDPVTGSAAADLGMVAGERRRIGPVAPVERR